MKYFIGFLIILHRVTLNDIEMPFEVKISFLCQFDCIVLLGFQRQRKSRYKYFYDVGDNIISPKDSSFWRYKTYAYSRSSLQRRCQNSAVWRWF